MYIYIKYRDNQELLANPECTILVLIDYIRRKLGLPKKAIIDLCDEAGAMKLFFLSKTPREYASKFLTDQETYYVCRVRRAGRGTGLQNAYRAIVPILKNPEPAMLEGLRTQCEILERSRVKMLKILEAKRLAAIESAMLLQAKAKAGKSDESGPPPARKGLSHRPRVEFFTRKGKHRPLSKLTK